MVHLSVRIQVKGKCENNTPNLYLVSCIFFLQDDDGHNISQLLVQPYRWSLWEGKMPSQKLKSCRSFTEMNILQRKLLTEVGPTGFNSRKDKPYRSDYTIEANRCSNGNLVGFPLNAKLLNLSNVERWPIVCIVKLRKTWSMKTVASKSDTSLRSAMWGWPLI